MGIVLGRNHFSVSTVILLLLLAHLVGSAAWAANPEPIRFQHACEPGTQVQIGAVGDFLMHGPIQKKASMGGGFTALWKRWIPYMKQVDQMYGNLETPTAPGMLPGGKVIQDPGNVFDVFQILMSMLESFLIYKLQVLMSFQLQIIML